MLDDDAKPIANSGVMAPLGVSRGVYRSERTGTRRQLRWVVERRMLEIVALLPLNTRNLVRPFRALNHHGSPSGPPSPYSQND